jgi:hypothetical protein
VDVGVNRRNQLRLRLIRRRIAALGRVASERIARLPKAWPDQRRLGIVLQKPKPEGITYAVKLMVAVQRS